MGSKKSQPVDLTGDVEVSFKPSSLQLEILQTVYGLQHGENRKRVKDGTPVVLGPTVPVLLVYAELSDGTRDSNRIGEAAGALEELVTHGLLERDHQPNEFWPSELPYERPDGRVVSSKSSPASFGVSVDGVMIAAEDIDPFTGYLPETFLFVCLTPLGLALLDEPDEAQENGTTNAAPSAHRLRPCEVRAYQAYEFAQSRMDPPPQTDKAVYDWLKEYGSTEDYDLPSFETWQRHVRAGRQCHGTQKNTPRYGRTGRSIVRESDL